MNDDPTDDSKPDDSHLVSRDVVLGRDPVQLDRYVDGECTAAEVSAWRAAIAADPVLAAQVEVRRAFLEGLAGVGARTREQFVSTTPPELEIRVRAAIDAAATRGRRVSLLRFAAAAVVLFAIGAAVVMSNSEDAAAVPQALLSAAEIARSSASPDRPSAGCDDAATSPHAFPLVRDGELFVATCEPGTEEGTHARLYRMEDGPVVGYVAVPDKGAGRSTTVGKTVLGDVIVYDVMFGRSRAYLAVKSDFVAERGECAACHDETRVKQRNPHFIELRRWH